MVKNQGEDEEKCVYFWKPIQIYNRSHSPFKKQLLEKYNDR